MFDPEWYVISCPTTTVTRTAKQTTSTQPTREQRNQRNQTTKKNKQQQHHTQNRWVFSGIVQSCPGDNRAKNLKGHGHDL